MPKRGASSLVSVVPAKKPFIRQPRATTISRRIASNPSTFVRLPWYRFTYELQQKEITAEIVVRVEEIITQIRNRLQFAPEAKIRIKLSNAKVWVTAAGGSTGDLSIPELTASFYPVTTLEVSPYPRAQLNDSGTLNMPAKAAFKWPITDKMTIVDSAGAGTRNVVIARTNTNVNVNIRVNVWFQTGNIDGGTLDGPIKELNKMVKEEIKKELPPEIEIVKEIINVE